MLWLYTEWTTEQYEENLQWARKARHVTLYSVKQLYSKTIVHIVKHLYRMRDICTENKTVVRCEGASGSRKVSAPESGIAHCGFDTRVAQLTPCWLSCYGWKLNQTPHGGREDRNKQSSRKKLTSRKLRISVPNKQKCYGATIFVFTGCKGAEQRKNKLCTYRWHPSTTAVSIKNSRSWKKKKSRTRFFSKNNVIPPVVFLLQLDTS